MGRYYSTYRDDVLRGTRWNDDFYLRPGGRDYVNGYGGNDHVYMTIDLRNTNTETHFGLNHRWINTLDQYLAARAEGFNSYAWGQSDGNRTFASNIEHVTSSVIGGRGNDVVLFQNGSEYRGGDGFDHIFLDWSTNRDSIEWNSARNEQHFQLRDNYNNTLNTTISDFEQVSILTGTADDRIDLRASHANNDALTGDGNDYLYAGTGYDHLEGGRGNDVYAVNAHTTVVEKAGEGIDTVYLEMGTTQLTLPENCENLAVADNRYDNVQLTGNDADNVLTGAHGNDVLNGGRGADVMIGGDGNDTYYVDNLNDRIIDSGGDDTVIVSVAGYHVDRNVIEHVVYADGVQPDRPDPVGPVRPDPVRPDPVSPVNPGPLHPTHYDAGTLADTRDEHHRPYFIDALYCGGKFGHMALNGWEGFGHEHTVTYSFSTENNHGEKHFKLFTDAQMGNTEHILHYYESITNLHFVRVKDSGDSDIRFYRDDLTVSNTWSMPTSPDAPRACPCCGGIHAIGAPHNGNLTEGMAQGSDENGTDNVHDAVAQHGGVAGYAYYGGDVHINSQYYNDSFAPGHYSYTTLLHEIGHSVGMKHPGNYNAGGGGTGGPYLPGNEDNTSLTIMSYHQKVHNPDHLQDYDLATMHYLYGVNHATRAGDDTYHLNDRYIWDGAGHDTLDAHLERESVEISLQPGSWNYHGHKAAQLSAKGQSFIGYDTAIEDAIGSRYSDHIEGNGLANKLSGGDGNDVLSGLGGSDTLIGGNGNDILNGGASSDILTGGNGTDRFVFDTLPGLRDYDVITDFTSGETIELDHNVFTALSGSQHPGFALSNHAQGNEHLIFDQGSRTMFYSEHGASHHDLLPIFQLGAHADDLYQNSIVIV